MQLNEEQELQKLVASGIRIPPQPKVIIELQELILSGDYDVRDVVKIISQDPGIVAMLFKASKSPVFARGRDLTSIDKVVMVIGVKQVFNLVQAAALATTVSDGSRNAFETFWTRSAEVAQLAALVADERVSVCNVFPEQAYMAGIFHECGVPVLMMRFPEYCKTLQLGQAQCWPSLAEEDKKFNVDHTTIGYLVARHWKLPDFVCSAIRYHHELPEDELGASLSLICILQLAVHFHHRVHFQDSPLWASIGARVMEEVGLTLDEEEDFFGVVASKFNGADVS